MSTGIPIYCPHCGALDPPTTFIVDGIIVRCGNCPVPNTVDAMQAREPLMKRIAELEKQIGDEDALAADLDRKVGELSRAEQRIAELEEEVADSKLIFGHGWQEAVEIVNGVRTYDKERHIGILVGRIADLEAEVERLKRPSEDGN